MDSRYSFFGFPERPVSWQRFLPYALLFSLTFSLYAASLYFDFIWDDIVYVVENYRIQELSLVRQQAIWTRSYLGHYAPIQHTVLALLYSLSALEPFGYHLGQLLVHAACVCLLYFVLKKIESARVAFLASLLFAVHPTNIETVAWISETKSTLAFLFFLLSFWAFLRLRVHQRWPDGILCALFLILSLLSKINTVVAPVIFFLYDEKQGLPFRKGRLWSLLGFFLISAIFVAIHLASFHGSEQSLESAYYGGLYVHLINMPLLVLFYVRMVVFPHPLSAWHLFPVYANFNWVVGGAWVALLGIAWLLYRSGPSIRFWALWFLVFLAPVLQIVPFPIWVAERYLYIPAIGLFVLGSRLFFGLLDRISFVWLRWGWELAMLAILLAFARQTDRHLPIWRSNLALWEATTPACLTSAYCHMNLGLALLQAGRIQRGGDELGRAVEIRPAPQYLSRLGDAFLFSARDHPQAIQAYRLAVDKATAAMPGSPALAEYYAKLARAYVIIGSLEQAQQAIESGKHLDRRNPRLWVAESFLHWKQGNLDEARNSMRFVLIITGQRSNIARFIHYYWGDAAEVGRLLAALRSSPPASRP